MPSKSALSLSTVLSIFGCVCITFAQNNNTQLPLDKFSTKTAYEWAHPDNYVNYVKNELSSVQVDGLKCPASQISFVARHGSRYPSDGVTEKIYDLYDKINGNMNKDTNPEFVNWPDLKVFPIHVAGLLVQRGKEELNDLGIRLSGKLSDLLIDQGHDQFPKRFAFRSSLSERAQTSAKAFFEGMLEARNITASIDLKSNDTLVKFYKKCKRYIKEVVDNPTAHMQYEMYKNGPRIQKIGDKMASKLGIDRSLITSGKLFSLVSIIII